VNIRVRIERLVLDGLPVGRADGPLVRAAVEAELGKLLAQDGLAPELRRGAALPTLRAGSLPDAPPAGPGALGAGIAAAVHRGIGNPT